MKVLYLEAKNKQKSELNANLLVKLPKKLFLAYSIQYKSQANDIKKELEKNNIQVTGFQQVLGCSKIRVIPPSPILLIGSGRFHALNLAKQLKQPVYIYNSCNNSLQQITLREIADFEKKKQGLIAKFLFANKIGIYVSTKPGQNNLSNALKLKNKLETKGKKPYLFVSNSFNLSEIENFNLDILINSACPGLENDSSKLLNIDDIPDNF